MMAEGIPAVYSGRRFYITIASSANVDVDLPRHQKRFEAAYTPLQIVHIKDERYW